MKKKTTVRIVYAALFIALLVTFQYLSGALGQLVTGSLVNLTLILAVVLGGLYSGIPVALVSPVLAYFLNIGPMPLIQASGLLALPIIALGNLALVLVYYFVFRIWRAKTPLWTYVRFAATALCAATVKCGFLWLCIVKLLIPTLTTLKEKQVTAFSAAFGATQFVTAAIGGAVALLIIPTLQYAISRRK